MHPNHGDEHHTANPWFEGLRIFSSAATDVRSPLRELYQVDMLGRRDEFARYDIVTDGLNCTFDVRGHRTVEAVAEIGSLVSGAILSTTGGRLLETFGLLLEGVIDGDALVIERVGILAASAGVLRV